MPSMTFQEIGKTNVWDKYNVVRLVKVRDILSASSQIIFQALILIFYQL